MSLRIAFLFLFLPTIVFSQDRLYPVFLGPRKQVEAFIDVTGKIRLTIDTAYEVKDTHLELDIFHSGKLIVQKENPSTKKNDYFLMDETGKIITQFPANQFPGPIKNNLMMVERWNRWAIFDLNRNQKSNFVYDNYSLEFSEGLAAVTRNDSIGWVDETGRLVINPSFPRKSGGSALNQIYYNKYKDGRAQYTEKGLFGFIDREQRIVIPAQFAYVRDFSDGAAHVTLPDNRSGFIDTNGKWLIGPDKKDKYGDFNSGLHKMKADNGLYGYVDKKGNFVIKPVYEDASDFERGYAYVKEVGIQPNMRKIIDNSGNVKYEGYFQFARFGDPNLILVAQEGIFAGYYAFSNNFLYLDYNFKTIWNPGCDQRTITSVEVLKGCDMKKVKWISLTENLQNIDDVKPYLSKVNPVDLWLHPKKSLTEIPSEVMAMTNLEELNLSFNEITSIPASIKNLKNLKVLSLQFNKLSSLPPEIYQLKLKEIDLRNNKFDMKALMEIKKNMPGTRIIFKD